jgi:hypothetical protein
MFLCLGAESVEAEATSNKLTVIGKVDPLKIRDYLHYKTKKKVEVISPQPQKQDTATANKNNKEDKKSNDKKPDSDAKPKEVLLKEHSLSFVFWGLMLGILLLLILMIAD